MSGFHLQSAWSKQFNLAESKVLAIDSNSTNVKHFHAHSSCHIEWANVYVVDFQINFVIVLTPFLLFYLRYIDIFTWDKREKRLAKNQNWWKSFDMEQQRLNLHVHVIWLHANWKVSLQFFSVAVAVLLPSKYKMVFSVATCHESFHWHIVFRIGFLQLFRIQWTSLSNISEKADFDELLLN